METSIRKTDAALLQQNINLYQENRRLRSELEAAKRNLEEIKGNTRARVRGHMGYYQQRSKAKDVLSDIYEAGRVMAKLLLMTAAAWHIFMIVWGLRV